MGQTKRVVQFARTGNPPDVVEVVDLETGAVGEGEVLVDVEAAAINPSHLLTISGEYGVQLELPAVPGAEGIGRVVEVGTGVENVQVGERIMIPAHLGTWRQQMVVLAKDILLSFPPEGDVLQMEMLMANPPTAWHLLKSFVTLASGDWVIQNAANSTVGQYLMQLSRIYGYKTVNVVRREGLEEFIQKAGGDVCVVDGPDLGERVKAATNGAEIKLAVDAVAGESTQHLADCLTRSGVIMNYGLLSKKPCQLRPDDIIFRNISLRGFWLRMWLVEYSTREERKRLYEELRDYILDGRLHIAVEAAYPLSQIKQAVAHAMKQGRNGKVFVLPNAED